MEKVWVVLDGPRETGKKRDKFHGVFSSPEKARSCAQFLIEQSSEKFSEVKTDSWYSQESYILVKECPIDWFQ